MNRIAQLVAVGAIGAVALYAVGAARDVSAHASFVSANPMDKQVLTSAPDAVTMTFTENLASSPGSFISVSVNGDSAATGGSTVSASNTKSMSLPLKPGLPNGKYSVFWKTTSADDGGVTFGRFSFFVGQPDATDLANTAAASAIAVPDAATDLALSAGGTLTVKLAAGCNLVALTFPDGTSAETVAAAIAPAGTVAIWRYDAAAAKYAGYSNLAGAQNDLKTVAHLDAVWICLGAAATLTEPAA